MIKKHYVDDFSTFRKKLNESKRNRFGKNKKLYEDSYSEEQFATTIDEFFTWYTSQDENSIDWTLEENLYYIAEGVFSEGDEIGMAGARYLVKNKHKSITLNVRDLSNVFENSFILDGVEYLVDSMDKFTNRKGDTRTAADFGGDRKAIINYLKQDSQIKRISEIEGLYFDDADLVLRDKTVVRSLTWSKHPNYRNVNMAEVKKRILDLAKNQGFPYRD